MQQASVAKETSESPARNSYSVTPHDSNEIGTYEPKGVWVGSGGTIVGQLIGDTADRTFVNVANGTFLPFKFRLIKATGTTASDIVAVF